MGVNLEQKLREQRKNLRAEDEQQLFEHYKRMFETDDAAE